MEIIALLESGKMKQGDIARKFGVTKGAITQIKQKKDKIKEDFEKNADRVWLFAFVPVWNCKKYCAFQSITRVRRGRMAALEEALMLWFQRARSSNIQISGPLLSAQALKIAKKMAERDDVDEEKKEQLRTFAASPGFIQKFCQRHRISQFVECGESNSVPKELAAKGRAEAIAAISEGKYTLEDIYNADETGLFFQLPPSRTLAQQGENVKGVKRSKARITVMVCCNASGSDKRKLLVIGKSKQPRCFRGVNMAKLPCSYASTKKAWMSVELFNAFLCNLNEDMKKQKRNILLLVDNAPVHIVTQELSNIAVFFLEPNTTSVIQPCDAGIIRALKARYRTKLVQYLLDCMVGETKPDISVLTAISWIARAWKEISQATIQNCWIHTGLIAKKSSSTSSIEPVPSRHFMSSSEAAIEQHLCNLIQQMKLEDKLDASSFIEVDKDEQTFPNEIAIDESSIVEQVFGNGTKVEKEEEESEEEKEEAQIKPSQARMALELVKKYLLRQEELKEEHLMQIEELSSAISLMENQKKQTKINQFFKLEEPCSEEKEVLDADP